MISEWDQHRDVSIAPVCQRKDAKPVEYGGSVGDGRKQPVEVVFINALWEESNDFEESSSIRAKCFEHGGGQ